jgi:hypothetical protein
MPAPTLPTLLLCLAFSSLGVKNSLFRSPFLMASAQMPSVVTPPTSLLFLGNPWGVAFEETVACGFALERVELLPGRAWQVSARVSCTNSSFLDSPEHTAVLFIAPSWITIPTESVQVRTFLLSPNAWLPVGAAASIEQLPASAPSTKEFLTGEFDYQSLPRYNTSLAGFDFVDTPTTRASIAQHPTIPHMDLIHINTTHEVFTSLSSTNTSTDSENSIMLTVGVAFLDITNDNSNANDHIYSGRVGVPDLGIVTLGRSFTVVTSQRYSFIESTDVQVVETYSETGGWGYTAIVTLRLEDGVTAPRLEPTESIFAVAPSIAATDASMWNTVHCPDVQQSDIPTGCATDLIRVNSSFCQIETVWRDPLTTTDSTTYRFRVKLAQYNEEPHPLDLLFLRLRVHAVDIKTDLDTDIYAFMNLNTPLLANTIRCGATVVRQPDSRDGVRLELYTGSNLTPLKQGNSNIPLTPTATTVPLIASTASNLRARGIIDSIITIALTGADELFPPLSIRRVTMVDLISIHVRDESLHTTLNNLVHTGAAYSVRFTDKHITTSLGFEHTCATLPDHCARRELMRGGVVLLPAYVHVATSLVEDTTWLTRLFNDEAASPLIAETFTRNVYTAFQPNARYRRVAWVASTYEWSAIQQEGLKDHTILLASFTVEE